MQPVRLLPVSFSSVSLSSQPSSAGIDPVRLLPFSFNTVSSYSRPSAAGIVPVRLSLARSICVTRSGSPPVVTPSQLAIAVAALQFNVPVPAKVDFAPSSSSQSRTSSRFSFGLAITVPFVHVGAAIGCAGVNVVVSPSPGVMSP